MLTISVDKRVHPARLHAALATAGLKVATVRARGDTAEVVLEDGEDQALATTVITNHRHDQDQEKTQLQTALDTLENEANTQAQRLNAAFQIMAKLARNALANSD